MLGFNAFRRKPRQFEYKPRHYDPEQEARNERRKELLGVKAFDNDSPEEYVPGKYIKQSSLSRRGIGTRRRTGQKPMRYVIALLLMMAILIWILS